MKIPIEAICMAVSGLSLLGLCGWMWSRMCARRAPKVTWIKPEEQDEE